VYIEFYKTRAVPAGLYGCEAWFFLGMFKG